MNRNLQHMSPVSNHTVGKERQSMETGPYSFVQEPSTPASQHQSYIQTINRNKSLNFLRMNLLNTCSVKRNRMLNELQSCVTSVSANRIKVKRECHKEIKKTTGTVG